MQAELLSTELDLSLVERLVESVAAKTPQAPDSENKHHDGKAQEVSSDELPEDQSSARTSMSWLVAATACALLGLGLAAASRVNLNWYEDLVLRISNKCKEVLGDKMTSNNQTSETSGECPKS